MRTAPADNELPDPSSDPSGRADDLTARDRLAVIARHSFFLPYADRYSALGRSTRHRSKRVGKRTQLSTEDLFLGPPATSGPAACPCYHCLEPNHTYHTETAFLQFSFTVNTSEACCANCSRMNLVLYQYVNMDDALMCYSLNFTPQVVSGLRLVNTDRNITQGPVDYPNIGTGCYAFRLRPSVNPSPIYHGFLWLKAKVNVTNMDDWNTTFFLQPDHGRGSLEVRWTAPSYPYNFSSYGLQLWHNENTSITCRGETIYKGPIVVIPKNEKIYLTSTNYTFTDLRKGWYCVRVTPIDDRCPPDGCQPRSSLAKQLLDVVTDRPEKAPESITPGVLGAGVAILLAGVLLACLVIRCRSSRGVFGVSYTKVHIGKKLNEGGAVLLVWTKTGPYGEHLAPVVLAFKKTLVSYCKFKVYDYLDLMSLPSEHRQHLLASPAAWLDTILAQHSIKIIIVGSEGARQRQLEGMCGGGGGRHTNSCERDDPLDVLLFPYLLRRLQDRPDLAGDYSRVFHVRFSDICSEKAELEGVVSWTRFRLPEHLRSLTLSLHGISEEAGCDLEEPPADLVAEMTTAMAGHPMHRASRSHHPNNHLSKDAHTTAVPVPPLPTPPSSEASCDGHSSDAGPEPPDAPPDANRLGKL